MHTSSAMKGMHCNSVMRFGCESLPCMVKATQSLSVCQSNLLARGLSHITFDKITKYRSCHNIKAMSYINKRSILQHTPSMGLIGHGFNPRKHEASHSFIAIEDHVLSFAETFSTTTGKSITFKDICVGIRVR